MELNINETAYGIFGCYNDGGYVGDGIISGHHTRHRPQPCPQPAPAPTPDSNPTEPIS